MDIDKIHDAMKVLKEECKKYKQCSDCIFHDTRNENTACYLEKAPDGWNEDEIIENNCTTAHYDDTDEWWTDVIRCDNCDNVFMLGGSTGKDHVIGKFCPHCGKKIVDYVETTHV